VRAGEEAREALLYRATGLGRRFSRRGAPALVDVDLELRAGQRLGLVGGSGAGKTTLARLLLALDRADTGTVTYRDRAVRPGRPTHVRWLRRAVQLVPQDPGRSLDPRLPVGISIAEPLECLGIGGDHRARVAELLLSVGLEPDAAARRPHEFSGGQRQRIAIARALAPEPEVLVADEPVSALDTVVRRQVLDLLRGLSTSRGLALVVVSHDLGAVARLCSDVLVLDGGRVVECGPVPQVFSRPRSPVTRSLLDAVPRLPWHTVVPA
jgi:peptide/nickel transport system ATP-binding protein